jgi:hypothetical protein
MRPRLLGVLKLCWPPHPEPEEAPSPTDAELKVRATLVAFEKAATSAATRSNGMDTKASLLLIVAGVLTATGLPGIDVLTNASASFALAAALFALISLWPRRVKGIHPVVLTKRITSSDESFADYEFYMLALEKAASIRREKSLQIRGVLLAIGFSLAFVAMALGLLAVLELDSVKAWLESMGPSRPAEQSVPSESPMPTAPKQSR